MLKILNIVGARPNFMKIAPLMAEMARHDDVDASLVHTGQHYDENLSKVFFEDLGIPRPDINLGVGSGSREEQIERIREAFRPVVESTRPDAVLVVGDVNSTIACAGVAKERGIAVVHVEAGLRSFDPDMPEEHNRRETDAISDYLFVTEESGMRNLDDENNPGKRFLVGNVMIDTLVRNLPRARKSPIVGSLGLESRGYAVATFHRPSNVDARDSLRAVVETIRGICDRMPLVLPLHPRTRHSLASHDMLAEIEAIPALHLVEPLGYLDFLGLVSASRVCVTDSGGIQEETTYLRVPCLTMRENTERPATIEVGSNVLVGSDRDKLFREIERVLDGSFKSGDVPPLWDGKAAERIVAVLREEIPGRT